MLSASVSSITRRTLRRVPGSSMPLMVSNTSPSFSLYSSYRSLLTSSAPLYQSWARSTSRPWMCKQESCRSVNKAPLTVCEACGEQKPVLQGWKCVSCGTRNFKGVRKCKSCREPADASSGFWMCIACEGTNRVDELEDNSRCGHCGYDMAPMTMSEEYAANVSQQQAAEYQEQQVAFDSISAGEAEEQFSDVASGAERLPPHLRRSQSSRATQILGPTPEIKPFNPGKPESRHSRLHRKLRVTSQNGSAPPGPPGFDWVCREATCAAANPGDEENCTHCGKHINPVDWECQQCSAMNHLSRTRCFSCETPIPMSWTCGACEMATSIYDTVCRSCGQARTAVEPRAPSEVMSDERSTSKFATWRRGEDWNCDECSAMNFARRTECFQCGSARVGGSGGSPHSPSRRGDGGGGKLSGSGDWGVESDAPVSKSARSNRQNWLCSDCKSSNFRTRTVCWQCGSAAPADWRAESNTPSVHFDREGFQDDKNSKPAEGKMNSWKKDDDWTCAKCFSKNFRSRMDCYRCGAPKLAVSSKRTAVRRPVKL